jgi:hypothetical protein
MITLEIPRQEWMSSFDALTRRHADEPIRLEVLRLDMGGARTEVPSLPLHGIATTLISFEGPRG